MYLGKLVETGPADDVFSNPAHHYTQGLLDAVPIPDVLHARDRQWQTRSEASSRAPSTPRRDAGSGPGARRPTSSALAEVPPFSQVSEGHVVACHHPLRTTTPVSITGAVPAAPAG